MKKVKPYPIHIGGYKILQIKNGGATKICHVITPRWKKLLSKRKEIKQICFYNTFSGERIVVNVESIYLKLSLRDDVIEVTIKPYRK